MNTCDTCKWWDSEAVFMEYIRRCRCAKFDVVPEEPLCLSGVVQCGMDAGHVYLATGPKFGCVHHEAK